MQQDKRLQHGSESISPIGSFVPGLPFAFPAERQYTSCTQRVRIPAHGKVVQRILIHGKPTEVQVNDGTVPEIQATVHITKPDEPAANPPSSSQSNPPQP